MDNRFNTVAGWALAGGVVALGLSIVSGMIFHSERPEHMGYVIEGVEEGGDAGAAPAVPLPVLLASADATKGADVFKKCTACHTIEQGGPNGIGPNLYATMGEAIAQGKNGYAFSDALKGIGGSWDFEKMDAWLASPRKFAPGTKMTFAGIPDAQERANLIVWLNAQGSNLPLPAAPAAAAASADNAVQSVDEGNSAVGAHIGANEATPAEGAPSQDPQAKAQADKAGLPKSND